MCRKALVFAELMGTIQQWCTPPCCSKHCKQLSPPTTSPPKAQAADHGHHQRFPHTQTGHFVRAGLVFCFHPAQQHISTTTPGFEVGQQWRAHTETRHEVQDKQVLHINCVKEKGKCGRTSKGVICVWLCGCLSLFICFACG